MGDGGKYGPWGDPIVTHQGLSGKTGEELASWAANCSGKAAFYLPKIPTEDSDGFWEVRVCWLGMRANCLKAARIRLLEMNSPSQPERSEEEKGYTKLPAIHALYPTSTRPNLGGWPGGQPVSFTNTSAREAEAGSIEAGPISENAPPLSPTALLEEVLAQPHWPSLDCKKMIQPFKPPRKRALEEEKGGSSPPLRRSKRERKKNKLYCEEDLSNSE